MSALILPVLAILGSITALAGLSLFVYKLIRFRRERFDEFRRASYIGALSEMATRSGYPLEMLRRWSPDGVFLETLLEFLKFLQGGERQNCAGRGYSHENRPGSRCQVSFAPR